MEKEFEDYWKTHQQELIKRAPEMLRAERANNGKMNTMGDWILFAVPVIIMVFFLQQGFIANEILNLIVGFLIGAVVFFLTILIKPYVTGKRSIVDIDQDIKSHFYEIYRAKGIKGLVEG